MSDRKRIKKHPWQEIAKPFAFKAWTKKNNRLQVAVETKWQGRHPEFAR